MHAPIFMAPDGHLVSNICRTVVVVVPPMTIIRPDIIYIYIYNIYNIQHIQHIQHTGRPRAPAN